MSEYGVKIRNYQAGSIFEYNNGVRSAYDFRDSMLTNSLFSYFLRDNGLNVSDGGSTRDIIGINFDYGGQSYEMQVKRMKKLIKETENSDMSENKKSELISKYNDIMEDVHKNKDKYIKRSAQKIREDYYQYGVDIYYPTYHDNEPPQKIHYKMLYRTPGKGKKGSCMFIREELYDIARDYLYMGIKLPEENAPIVEIGAYSSLVTSTIVGTVEIDPRRILILKDVDSFFKTNVVSVEVDENKQCVAKHIDNYTLKNTLFDGQALIDLSIFPEWGDGYILLRQHFTKCAAFATDIQLFFKDYFGDKYETAELTDMWGNKILAKDVLLITTDNAIKWIKFDVSFDYWCDWVNKSHNLFGIVKTAHPSKLGNVQRMSYQMVNALDVDNMDEVMSKSYEYVNQLNYDMDAYLDYLERNANFANDYEAVVAIVKHNPDFVNSDWFLRRKSKIINQYVKKLRAGKLIQNADNCTVVLSPIAMLYHAVGDDVEKDGVFENKLDCIQCYSARFADGARLGAFRSPFNSERNLCCLENHYDERMTKYFRLGKYCIAINGLHTDIQDRNNGLDQDSDSLYVTDNPAIAKHAQYCYEHYHTIVNNIPKESNHYNSDLKTFARVDNNFSGARRTIGESSNLAQVALSYHQSYPNVKKYDDYCSILSVLAQASIDSLKRTFSVNIAEEIERIKEDMHIDKHGYPAFWLLIRPGFNKDRINYDIKCPMNCLANFNSKKAHRVKFAVPISEYLSIYPIDADIKLCKDVEALINKYNINLFSRNIESLNYNDSDYYYLITAFDDMIADIQKMTLGEKYKGLFSWLLNKVFSKDVEKEIDSERFNNQLQSNKSVLLKTLYNVNKDVFLKCFEKNLEKTD